MVRSRLYKSTESASCYVDYHAEDFLPKQKPGYGELTYVGDGSASIALTPQISIERLSFENHDEVKIPLNEKMTYTFYALEGGGIISENRLEKDDAIRLYDTGHISVNFKGELFYVETPGSLSYQTVWS